MAGRRRLVAGSALVVAVTLSGLWLSWRATLIGNAAPGLDHRSPLCTALAEDVPGVGAIHWDNGITSSGSWWIQVLGSDGLQQADAASRERIAIGVAADSDGFQRLRSAAPENLRPALDRLEPSRSTRRWPPSELTIPQFRTTFVAVARSSNCGWAP